MSSTGYHHFDRSALPPPKTFYERELGKLTRPSRGWSRGNCPFHTSKSKMSFSANLATGGFYCFGCNAKGGDVLDFVKLRDKVDFKRAAQLFGAWRDIGPAEEREIRLCQQEKEQRRVEEATRKQAEHDRRIKARDWLHCAERLYDLAKAEHDWDLLSSLLPEIREAETSYWQAAGLEERHEP